MSHHARIRLFLFGLFALAALFAGSRLAIGEAPLPKEVLFNRDVRPILSNNCFACHGPDKNQRKGDLRLDLEEDAFAERDGHRALVPGKLADSKLFEKITAQGKERMPPAKFGKELSKHQIELIRRWIEQGAKWQKHWSRITPKRPELPPVSDKNWPRNPVDHFVLYQLDQNNLKPSPEADRRTLVRRLSFDLLGLPTTPEDVESALNDKSNDWYERLVDRLLASKHFGERMAIYWLDVVRYADTAGYHSDNHRDISPYRDYVIKAFNDNKPFDKFTIEQLAGDLLPDPTVEQRIASGFNRLLQTTEEGGAQAKEYTAKYAADRVRNTASIFLGMTLGCCECHDHKFDPYTTRDFYSMAAFFADINERAVGRQEQVPVPNEQQAVELKKLDEQLAELKKKLDTPTPQLEAAQKEWETKVLADVDAKKLGWIPLKAQKAVSQGGANLKTLDDLSVLTSGANPAKDTYTVTLTTDMKNITGIRLEALPHASLANKLARGNGNFVLTRFEVEATFPADNPLDKPVTKPVAIASAIADYSQAGHPIASVIDPKPGAGWAVDGHQKLASHQAVFTFAQPIAGGPATTITVRLKHESTFAQHNIGCFRLALTSDEKPSLDKTGLSAAILTALRTEPGKRTAADKDALAKHYRGIAPELEVVRTQHANLDKLKQDKLKALPTSLVSMAVAPRMVRVLPRGNWLDDSGEIVTPNTPTGLPLLSVKERRATRLDLANWMVAADNPMVSRVFVNRLWKLFFGQGVVKSLDDFGSQGTWPTHPDLLDWLAVEFVAPQAVAPGTPATTPWNVKHMIKTMVLSSAYRQTSYTTEQLKQLDPYNQLLARQARFRLDAEMVRDNVLATSGLLSRKIGGPSVKPYQPPGYWTYLNFPKREWQKDEAPEIYRRGLYTYWQRTFLHPSLLAFDAPSREECTVDRPRSNTPLQALVLLNDPTYVEAARSLAERIVREGGSGVEARIQFAYRQVLARRALSEEVKLLTGMFEQHLKQYQADKASAEALLTIGDRPAAKDIDAAELAAWTSIARVVLNLHETITRN